MRILWTYYPYLLNGYRHWSALTWINGSENIFCEFRFVILCVAEVTCKVENDLFAKK